MRTHLGLLFFVALAPACAASVQHPTSAAGISFARRCEGGDGESCHQLAVLFAKGYGEGESAELALEYHRRGCAAARPSATACNDLGYAYQKGRGVAQDIPRGAALYVQACELGSILACNNAGVVYHGGLGVPRDPARALALFTRACGRLLASACNNLGRMVEHGEVEAPDPTRAAELFRKACELGAYDGCTRYGWMFEQGRGVERDAARAFDFYRRACIGGDPPGCGNVGVMYETGAGVPSVDYALAAAYYDKGCKLGLPRACQYLARLHARGRLP